MADAHKAASRNSQRFGPYVVCETIGRGTFAKVKIAIHETTKVRVALKIIPRKVMDGDAHSATKIRREIKVMKVLRHPHITRLYDVVKTKHDIVLVLEFVSGGELFDYISKRGRLDDNTSRVLFQQLAGAVAYCHRYRVTHRDIKPENIMMEHGSHNIKLSDFGLSSITHDGRFFETSCGTPNYASPEVVSGQLYGGPETDVWSCGVVLYAMLTGTLPFDDSNVSGLFRKIQTADYPPPRGVSREAADLIRRMLTVNPLERATMEQVMHHPWLKVNFPPYLLSLHYGAVLDTMRFAKDHSVSEEMLDEEVVRVVASRFRMTPQQVVDIVAGEEENMPSMWEVLAEDGSGGDDAPAKTRRYPAAHYWETFSNVLDSKLWPTPLDIPPAEVALRDETHDIVVSYLILTQKKQNRLGPEEYAKRSFGESANNLLQSQSQQGYGSLNANSLHQLSTNSSFTGSSLAQTSTTNQTLSRPKERGEKILFPLAPEKSGGGASGAATTVDPDADPADDPWMEGYNYLAAPFLPLHHEQSQSTLLGYLFKVNEFPVSLLRSRNLEVQALERSCANTSMVGSFAEMPVLLRPVPNANLDAPGNGPAYGNSGVGGSSTTSSTLLRPLTPLDASRPHQDPLTSTPRATTPSGKQQGRRESRAGSSPGKGGSITPAEQETVLDRLYRVEVATRFGNDFIRHGVLFRSTTPHDTLRATYTAMREEGLIWRPICDYYFSCVRFPNVKLQVKIYKVTKEEQIVDVKVSAQSGMVSYDAAISLLDRLRTKAIRLGDKSGKKAKKRNSLLTHFSATSTSKRDAKPFSAAGGATFSSSGKGSIASTSSVPSASASRKR